MSRRCSSCNAVVGDGMKLCPNCGRLISAIGEKHEYQPPERAARPASGELRRSDRPGTSRSPAGRTAKKGSPRRAQPSREDAHARRAQPDRRPVRAAEPEGNRRKKAHTVPQSHRHEEKELPAWTGIVKVSVLIVVILAAVYIALFTLQVLRVKKATYEFNTTMTLTASNYGEAFENSVKDGSWSYNPFTFTVTYKGIHDGEDIAVKFSAWLDLKVESITVGKEVKTEAEQINNYLMGLFI